MQGRVEGMQMQAFEGPEDWIRPACVSIEVNSDHMIGMVLAELQRRAVERRRGQLGLLDRVSKFVGLNGQQGT